MEWNLQKVHNCACFARECSESQLCRISFRVQGLAALIFMGTDLVHVIFHVAPLSIPSLLESAGFRRLRNQTERVPYVFVVSLACFSLVRVSDGLFDTIWQIRQCFDISTGVVTIKVSKFHENRDCEWVRHEYLTHDIQ